MLSLSNSDMKINHSLYTSINGYDEEMKSDCGLAQDLDDSDLMNNKFSTEIENLHSDDNILASEKENIYSVYFTDINKNNSYKFLNYHFFLKKYN